MKKIRILFTIPNFITAGSGREMFNIIERLDQNLFECYIVVQKAGGTLFEEIISKGYEIIVQPFVVESKGNMLGKIIAAWHIASGYRKYHFDIWQSFNWSSDYTEALIARFAGVRYFYVKKNMNWDRMAWKVKSLLSHHIVARNTTLIETYFAQGLFRHKTSLITGGVDVNKFKPGKSNGFRAKYNIPIDAIIVASVAQLVRSKDQLTLIKAVANFRDVFLVLAGAENDEEYKRDIIDLTSKLKLGERVILVGKIDNVIDLLNSADLFVLPTSKFGEHEEGCPVSLLEAMSAGVPAIASDVAGNRDLIIHEQTGLLFEAENVQELTENVRRYIDDIQFAKTMSDAALKKVHLYHSLETEAKAFSNLYQTALK